MCLCTCASSYSCVNEGYKQAKITLPCTLGCPLRTPPLPSWLHPHVSLLPSRSPSDVISRSLYINVPAGQLHVPEGQHISCMNKQALCWIHTLGADIRMCMCTCWLAGTYTNIWTCPFLSLYTHKDDWLFQARPFLSLYTHKLSNMSASESGIFIFLTFWGLRLLSFFALTWSFLWLFDLSWFLVLLEYIDVWLSNILIFEHVLL